MRYIARAAHNLGVKVVTGFMGGPIWKYWYSFPQTGEAMIDNAFKEIVKLCNPFRLESSNLRRRIFFRNSWTALFKIRFLRQDVFGV
jgi:hypothetical protein